MSDVKPNPCPACGEPCTGLKNNGYVYCDKCDFPGTWPVDLWNRIRLAPVASDETIPVRIAVVVDANGEYTACECDAKTDDEAVNNALVIGDIRGPYRATFVTALAYRPHPTMEAVGDSEAR